MDNTLLDSYHESLLLFTQAKLKLDSLLDSLDSCKAGSKEEYDLEQQAIAIEERMDKISLQLDAREELLTEQERQAFLKEHLYWGRI